MSNKIRTYKNYLRGGAYSYSPPRQHRSGLEDNLARQIKRFTTEAYERYKIKYTVPAIEHTYTPDFVLPNGVIIEAKGLFEVEDRHKHLYIKEQYPHLDIRFVFQNPNNTIYKGSPTTYAMWCEKHGFKYAKRYIPAEWFAEPKHSTKGLIKK